MRICGKQSKFGKVNWDDYKRYSGQCVIFESHSEGHNEATNVREQGSDI
jgi:hypothetical protein